MQVHINVEDIDNLGNIKQGNCFYYQKNFYIKVGYSNTQVPSDSATVVKLCDGTIWNIPTDREVKPIADVAIIQTKQKIESNSSNEVKEASTYQSSTEDNRLDMKETEVKSEESFDVTLDVPDFMR